MDGFRELRRTPVRFAFHLAVARLITQWRSLLTIIAGTILAASIGALVPLYTTAIAQVGMLQRLDEQAPREAHVSSQIMLRASEWEAAGGLEQIAAQSTNLVFDHVADDLGVIQNWVDKVVTYGETGEMGIGLPIDGSDAPQPLIGIRARVGYYEGWQDQVRVVEGRLPRPGDAGGVDMEIAIGLNVVNEVGSLSVDKVLILDQRIKGDGSIREPSIQGLGYEDNQPLTVRIVGIVAPSDEDDPYWMAPSPLRLTDRVSSSWDYEFIALTTRDNLYRTATEFLPGPHTRIGWRMLFAHDNLPFARIDEATRALDTFKRDMVETFDRAIQEATGAGSDSSTQRDLQFQYFTQLTPHQARDIGILAEYADEVELLGAPFGLLLLQVGALVLFFLMVTAALVRRGERREIAMLQSRGAWDSQIVLLRGIEALLICALAVIIAPFLSQALLSALGPTIAETDDFPLPLTGDVFAFAGLAAAVTFLALMFTLRPVLRLPLVLAGGSASRAEQQHWWQKFYLDALLAVVGIGALALLVRNGSPLSDVNLGGQKADPLMLLAPALLFLALGSLALRFFPLIAQALAHVTATGRGLLSSLASWQLSREPVHYGRITFLLALAIGIGWFATSFRATLSNSHEDQARYKAGTDLRFVERDTVLNANRARSADYYSGRDEVAAASIGFRIPNATLGNRADSLRGNILAIDPDTYGDTLYWRSDLGDIYTPSRPGQDPNLPTRGEALPITPDRIGFWARFDIVWLIESDDGTTTLVRPQVGRLLNRTDINLRLLDADGVWVVVPAEAVEIEYERRGSDAPGAGAGAFVYSGWVYYEADLDALAYDAQGPLRLVSFFWEYRSPSSRGERGMRLTLADMTLIDAGGTAQPYPVFADNNWEFEYDRIARATGKTTPGAQLAGERSDALYIRWDQEEGSRTVVGALLNYPDLGPIDAIVSTRVQQENALSVGPDATPIRLINIAGSVEMRFRAVQVADYYPSLYDVAPTDTAPGDSFMVVDVRQLLYRLNRRPSATYYPSEVWLRFEDGFDAQDKGAVAGFLEKLERASDGQTLVLSNVSLAEELDKLQTDPLGLGLLGLMYLAFIMALTLSVVGLLTYAGLTAQARRTEFGVLRALGLSSLRVVGGLALEQTFVMVIGVTLGAVLGAVLADQVVPTLALGAAGEGVVPPFVIRVEVRRLLEYGVLMLSVLLLVLSSSLLLVRQLSLSRTLRLGEE